MHRHILSFWLLALQVHWPRPGHQQHRNEYYLAGWPPDSIIQHSRASAPQEKVATVASSCQSAHCTCWKPVSGVSSKIVTLMNIRSPLLPGQDGFQSKKYLLRMTRTVLETQACPSCMWTPATCIFCGNDLHIYCNLLFDKRSS